MRAFYWGDIGLGHKPCVNASVNATAPRKDEERAKNMVELAVLCANLDKAGIASHAP